jgi:hypothetical protein
MRISEGDEFRLVSDGVAGWWHRVVKVTPSHVYTVNPSGHPSQWPVEGLLLPNLPRIGVEYLGEPEFRSSERPGARYIEFVIWAGFGVWAKVTDEEAPPEVSGGALRRVEFDGLSLVCQAVRRAFTLPEGGLSDSEPAMKILVYRDFDGEGRTLLASRTAKGGKPTTSVKLDGNNRGTVIGFNPSPMSIRKAIMEALTEARKNLATT